MTYEGESIPETSDRERSSGRECGVILSPVGGLVAGLWLPGFTHVQGYQCDGVGLCNKALYNTDTIRKYYGNNPAIKRSFE